MRLATARHGSRAVLFVAFALTACKNPVSTVQASVPGAGLVSWGNYIYIIGGRDSSGTCRPEIWRATVGSGGSLGSWTAEGSLPQALAFAACAVSGCSSGDFLYVIGGEGASGLLSTVYFTRINADGSLGFSSSTWIAQSGSLPSLPEPRSRAAPVVLGGRIVLLGGRTAGGATATAIGARVWENGFLWQWYQAAGLLPAAGEGYAAAAATAVSGSTAVTTVYLAGGGSGALYSAQASASGLPGAWAVCASGPGGALQYPALADTADGLFLVGGIDGSAYAAARVLGSGSWTSRGSIEATGPQCAVVAGTLFAVSSVQGPTAPVVASARIQTAQAEAPLVVPGGGVLPSGVRPVVTAALSSDGLGYSGPVTTGLPAEPTQSDGTFTAPKVTAAGTYAFRAFRGGALPSPVVYAAYRPLSVGTFFLIKQTLTVSGSAPALSGYTMTEDYSNGTSSNVASVWFKLLVGTRSTVGLLWAGSGGSGSYTAPVRLSLFEGDDFTPALDSGGSEIYQSQAGSASAVLGPGTYFVLVESTDGSTGGSFGLGVGTGS